MNQMNSALPLAELADRVLFRMNKIRSSPHAWVLAKHGKIHTHKNTGMSL
jgi:hypothetical protein